MVAMVTDSNVTIEPFAIRGTEGILEYMVTNDVISDHEVRIYRLVSSQPESLFTNNDIAREANVAARTARQYTRRWTDTKLLDETQMFPGYLYRWTGSKAAYVGKLKEASDRLEIYDAGKVGKQ